MLNNDQIFKKTKDDNNCICFHRPTLRGHMFTVHGEGTGLVCALCGAKFYNKSHLKTHMNSKHETAKLYQCDLCEKSYKYPAGLKIHKLTHTGEELGHGVVQGGGTRWEGMGERKEGRGLRRAIKTLLDLRLISWRCLNKSVI